MDKTYHDKVMKSLTMLMEMYDLDVTGFSERCGMPVERLESFIAGEKDLMVPDLVAIVRAFNVSSDFIIGDFPFPFPSPRTEKERELFEKIENMDPEQLDELMSVLRSKKN